MFSLEDYPWLKGWLDDEPLIKPGWLTVGAGTMFSDKTIEEALRIEKMIRSNMDYLFCGPSTNKRYIKEEKRVILTNRSDSNIKYEVEINLFPPKEPQAILRFISENKLKIGLVLLEELQTWGPELLDVVQELRNMGIAVMGTGCDLDFKGNVWGQTLNLFRIADTKIRMYATCMCCLENKSRLSARIGFQDVNTNDQQVLDGRGGSIYVPLCTRCYKATTEEGIFNPIFLEDGIKRALPEVRRLVLAGISNPDQLLAHLKKEG